MNVPGLLFFVKDVADMVFDMAFHMAFPFWEEIQEQGCGIEFAYARTAKMCIRDRAYAPGVRTKDTVKLFLKSLYGIEA